MDLSYIIDEGKNLKFHGCSNWNKGFIMETHSIKLECTIDNKVIGQAGLEYKYKKTEGPFTDGYIFGVSVNPKYQHNGVGSKLINKIEEIAKDIGLKVLYLRPATEEVKYFYNKLGYKYSHTDEYGEVMSKNLEKSSLVEQYLFKEESAENLKKLINQVDKALYSWAKEQQIKKSKNTNGTEFELHCELKGDGTYITITIPDTVGYFPLNHALLDFIDFIDADPILQSLCNNATNSWTIFKNQGSDKLKHDWKSETCIEIAHCAIPGIWSDPDSNGKQVKFLNRILQIIQLIS